MNDQLKAKTAEEKIIDDLFGKHLHPDSQSCCGITFDHVAAMKEYGQMCAEQARKEEQEKTLDIVKAFTAAVNAKLTCREMIAHMNPFFKAAGYELERIENKEKHNQNKER